MRGRGLPRSRDKAPPRPGCRPARAGGRWQPAWWERSRFSRAARRSGSRALPGARSASFESRTSWPLRRCTTARARSNVGSVAISAEKYQRGRVVVRKDYAKDLWSIRVAPEKHIDFEAGQYVTLGLPDGQSGKMIERAYSVCSAPAELERAAAGSGGWLKYIPTVSRPWEDADWRGEVGRAEDVLRKYLDLYEMTPENCSTYLCGHPQMIENGKGILLRRGFDRAQVHVEIYWMPPRAEKAAAT